MIMGPKVVPIRFKSTVSESKSSKVESVLTGKKF